MGVRQVARGPPLLLTTCRETFVLLKGLATMTAKKSTTTTTRKTSARKSAGSGRFEKFRQRAIDAGLGVEAVVTNDPFVLDEADGFTPPIELERPSFSTRVAVQDALSKNDIVRAMVLIFGNDVNRVIEVLDAYERETGESSAAVFNGIVIAYTVHFFGEGSQSAGFPGALG